MRNEPGEEEARIMREAKNLLVGFAILIGAVLIAGTIWHLINQ